MPGAGNPQAFNRYAYVLNNPMNFVDPSGHAPICLDDWCQNIAPTVGVLSSGSGGGSGNSGQPIQGDLPAEKEPPPDTPIPGMEGGSIFFSPEIGVNACEYTNLVQCFYAGRLLEMEGGIDISWEEMALLFVAIYFDLKQKDALEIDIYIRGYDTPFYNGGGFCEPNCSVLHGEGCLGGICYDRTELNYIGVGMVAAHQELPLGVGRVLVWLHNAQYGHPPTLDELRWFHVGHSIYRYLDAHSSTIFEQFEGK